ncbi:MAG: hydroxymethylglutaryl-CoA lyase [Bacteroidia bacterium]|nr:hydroxymethylglutaryl-CoA lyase [Bacteroidia bacterium]MCZ2249652.1 hydroxymethylglutaryl-CoA lyase [Bacteroidia bacterium]
MSTEVKLIECPRDAMQGIHEFIPTQVKADYINQLLKVGFDTIDFGSFVSPKAIPQLRDTAEVLSLLDLSKTQSKLLAIIANQRGTEDACHFEEIKYLGFPFSISETFQQRNTNSSITESLGRVEDIQNLCLKHGKELVIYISMAFGNPYGDIWNGDIAVKYTAQLYERGIRIFAMSDTIGCSNKENINDLFGKVIPEFKNAEIGAHLHSTPETRFEKIKATYESGCRRFDGAIHGIGGCPMAKEELTGNLATESLIQFFEEHQINHGLNNTELNYAYTKAKEVFGKLI